MSTGYLVLVLVLATLAGARTWRLIALDEIAEPIRKLMRRGFYQLSIRGHDKKAEFLESGVECPYCLGFYLTAAWLGTGLMWGEHWLWLLIAGAFALNWVQATLNAWNDVHPVVEGGGEIEVGEDESE